MDLPIQFKERMQRLLGEEEFRAYEESFHVERMYGLRVNTRKLSVEEFQQISPFEIKKIPWIYNGFYYDGNKDAPAKHPYYHAGLYYLQEPSAMTPASLLPVEPGDRVLDLCAAPGGKATELAVKLGGQGLLVANDISNSRAKGLLKNLELFGIPNLLVTNETPDRLLQNFRGFFDKILIDAPCSGEGMFRKDPAIIKSWVKKGPAEFAAIQRDIVSAAVQMLRPGGMLLYSTCTFSPEENEGTILHLLKEYPELTVQPVNGYEHFSKGRPEWLEEDCTGFEGQLSECIRIWPHKMPAEGHFITVLKKEETGLPQIHGTESYRTFENEDFDRFLGLLSLTWDKTRFSVVKDRVYYMPESSKAACGLHLLRSGLLLGECKKNRFEPSQALAMFLKKEQCAQTIDFPADDGRVIKYLKGETLDVEELLPPNVDGWHLVCVDGYPLGWGKLSKGTLKNKYHPGWRWM